VGRDHRLASSAKPPAPPGWTSQKSEPTSPSSQAEVTTRFRRSVRGEIDDGIVEVDGAVRGADIGAAQLPERLAVEVRGGRGQAPHRGLVGEALRAAGVHQPEVGADVAVVAGRRHHEIDDAVGGEIRDRVVEVDRAIRRADIGAAERPERLTVEGGGGRGQGPQARVVGEATLAAGMDEPEVRADVTRVAGRGHHEIGRAVGGEIGDRVVEVDGAVRGADIGAAQEPERLAVEVCGGRGQAPQRRLVGEAVRTARIHQPEVGADVTVVAGRGHDEIEPTITGEIDARVVEVHRAIDRADVGAPQEPIRLAVEVGDRRRQRPQLGVGRGVRRLAGRWIPGVRAVARVRGVGRVRAVGRVHAVTGVHAAVGAGIGGRTRGWIAVGVGGAIVGITALGTGQYEAHGQEGSQGHASTTDAAQPSCKARPAKT
jgi:hypothetical protein